MRGAMTVAVLWPACGDNADVDGMQVGRHAPGGERFHLRHVVDATVRAAADAQGARR